MNRLTGADIECPCCHSLNKGVNLRETDGLMECARCHVTVHATVKANGEIEVLGFDGKPYDPTDDAEEL